MKNQSSLITNSFDLDNYSEPKFQFEWDFKKKNDVINAFGLSYFEEWGCWSDGHKVQFELPATIISGYQFIYLYIRPERFYSGENILHFVVKSGFFVKTYSIVETNEGSANGGSVFCIKIPINILSVNKPDKILIDISIKNPMAASIYDLNDKRKIAIGFLRLGIDNRDIERIYKENIYDKIVNINSYLNTVPHFFDSFFPVDVYIIAIVLQSIFTKFRLEFFFYCGTLLGAVRHGGLIPWDDDLDICLMESSLSNFELNVVPFLKNLGFDVFLNPPGSPWSGYRVRSRNWSIRKSAAYCDIFILSEHKGVLVESCNFFKVLPEVRDTFPTKLIKFGGFDISVPNNYDAVLELTFGAQWKDVGKVYNHNFKDFIFEGEVKGPFHPAGPFIVSK